MVSTKAERALELFRHAMVSHCKYFDIKQGEVLCDDGNIFSMTIAVSPQYHPMDWDYELTGQTQFLQLEMDEDGDISLIAGEDDELELSVRNIYALLYWGEVINEVQDIAER